MAESQRRSARIDKEVGVFRPGIHAPDPPEVAGKEAVLKDSLDRLEKTVNRSLVNTPPELGVRPQGQQGRQGTDIPAAPAPASRPNIDGLESVLEVLAGSRAQSAPHVYQLTDRDIIPDQAPGGNQATLASLASMFGGQGGGGAGAPGRGGGNGGGAGSWGAMLGQVKNVAGKVLPEGEGKAALEDKLGLGMDIAGTFSGDPESIMRLAKRRIEDVQRTMDGLKEIGTGLVGGAVNAAQQQNVGEATASALEGLEKSFSGARKATLLPFEIPSPVSIMFEHFELLAGSAAKVVRVFNQFKTFGESLHRANMVFAEYSNSMARVQAKQEFREIQLSRQRGERRAEQAQALADSQMRLEQNTSRAEDWWANIQGRATAWINNKLSDIIEGAFGRPKDLGNPGGVGQGMVDQATNRNWIQGYGRPDAYVPPRRVE